MFYFPTSAGYMPYAADDAAKTIAPSELGSYLLSSFASVDEVKANIGDILMPLVICSPELTRRHLCSAGSRSFRPVRAPAWWACRTAIKPKIRIVDLMKMSNDGKEVVNIMTAWQWEAAAGQIVNKRTNCELGSIIMIMRI